MQLEFYRVEVVVIEESAYGCEYRRHNQGIDTGAIEGGCDADQTEKDLESETAGCHLPEPEMFGHQCCRYHVDCSQDYPYGKYLQHRDYYRVFVIVGYQPRTSETDTAANQADDYRKRENVIDILIAQIFFLYYGRAYADARKYREKIDDHRSGGYDAIVIGSQQSGEHH